MASIVAGGHRRLAATGGVDPARLHRRAAVLMLTAAALVTIRLAVRIASLVGVTVVDVGRAPVVDGIFHLIVLVLLLESLRDQGSARLTLWRKQQPRAFAALLVGVVFQAWQLLGHLVRLASAGDPLFTANAGGARGWIQAAIAFGVVVAMAASFLKLHLKEDLVIDRTVVNEATEIVMNADTLSTLGRCERLKGNLSEARMFYQLGLDAARRSGDPACLVRSLRHIADLQYVEGHYAEALVTYREMITVTTERLKDPVAAELRSLADETDASGDQKRAAAIRWEALLRSNVVDAEQLAGCFEGAAMHASTDDGGIRAARLRGVGEAIREAAAKHHRSWAAANPMYAVALLNGELDPAVAASGREDGRALSPDAAFDLVLEGVPSEDRTISLEDEVVVLDEPAPVDGES